jgi:hypothetical protein
MRVRFFSMLACLSLCGCASMQDYHYNWVQSYRADSAWRQSYGLLNTQFTRDYREGWKVGYADLSKGGCDEPPPVPPRKYWAAAYQSAEGKCCIDEWYNGWRDGAEAAKACGNADWHRITTAPTVADTGAPAQNTGPGTFVNPHASQPLQPMPRATNPALQPQPVAVMGAELESTEPVLREGFSIEDQATEQGSQTVGDNYSVPVRGVHPSPVMTVPNAEANPVSATLEESAEAPYGSAIEVFVDGAKN